MGRFESAASVPLITVEVTRIEPIAVDTLLFELATVVSEPLPAVAPGAHIDVHVAEDMVRQYSVIMPLSSPTAYVIASKRTHVGRGGSRRLHDNFSVGCRVQIARPRNNFPLNEFADETLLLAGGIGITPIVGMFRRLQELDRKVHLHYWSRSPEHSLFRDQLTPHPDVTIHHPGACRAAPASILQTAGPECEVYCCGPERMLREFETAAHARPRNKLHVERFSLPVMQDSDGDFSVVLAKSGIEVPVRRGETILGVLRDARVDVSYSCEEGVCGACEVKFLAGVPIHRDAVRTAAEHDRLSTVMICCAGSRTQRLTLDL